MHAVHGNGKGKGKGNSKSKPAPLAPLSAAETTLSPEPQVPVVDPIDDVRKAVLAVLPDAARLRAQTTLVEAWAKAMASHWCLSSFWRKSSKTLELLARALLPFSLKTLIGWAYLGMTASFCIT
eukprot:Skav227695  [mRNA]  locus=scaffold2761:139310:139681:- [translate_table: standard]